MSSTSNTQGLFSTAAMDAVFSPGAQIREMIRFEWALAQSLEACGVTPRGCAEILARLLKVDFLDAEALRADAVAAGNIAIPFVKQLTRAVAVEDSSAAGYMHWAATSQDVLDTGLVLQLRAALALFEADLERFRAGLRAQIRRHEATLMPGRTWLQQGPPVTLGLKLAGFLTAVERHLERLAAMRDRVLVVQFGGAVGTLASLQTHGARVSSELARVLGLGESALPWHTQRDGLVEVAAWAGMLMGTLGKLARDISLLMQNEVGEVLEGAAEGAGGSSTMPHKRNPVACAVMLSCAMRAPGLVATMFSAMTQEHERGLGGWHAEWETLPELMRLAAAALARGIELIERMEVMPGRMEANIALLRGLALSEAVSLALAEKIGRSGAHELLEEASRQATNGRSLLQVLKAMPKVTEHLSAERLNELLKPANYLGSTQEWISRALGAERKSDDA